MLPENIKKMLDDLENSKTKTKAQKALIVELKDLEKTFELEAHTTRLSMETGGICPACGRSLGDIALCLDIESGGNCPVCGR